MLFSFSQQAFAVTTVNGGDGITTLTPKEIKKQARKEARKAKVKAFKTKVISAVTPSAFDLKDPVQKYLWYAILAWAIAVLMFILAYIFAFSGIPLSGLIWLLGSLMSLLGSVAFVVWLIKTFSDL